MDYPGNNRCFSCTLEKLGYCRNDCLLYISLLLRYNDYYYFIILILIILLLLIIIIIIVIYYYTWRQYRVCVCVCSFVCLFVWMNSAFKYIHFFEVCLYIMIWDTCDISEPYVSFFYFFFFSFDRDIYLYQPEVFSLFSSYMKLIYELWHNNSFFYIFFCLLECVSTHMRI